MNWRDAVSVTELSLTGTMDARDFKYIRFDAPICRSKRDNRGILPTGSPVCQFHIIQQASCTNILADGQAARIGVASVDADIHIAQAAFAGCARTDRNQPSVYGRHDRQLCIFKCVETLRMSKAERASAR